MLKNIRALLYSGLFFVALVILPTLALAAPAADSVAWDANSDGYSKITLTFTETVTTDEADACGSDFTFPDGADTCYDVDSGEVSFDQSMRLLIQNSQVYRNPSNDKQLIVLFVGQNAFDSDASVAVTVNGIGGISSQTFDSFTASGFTSPSASGDATYGPAGGPGGVDIMMISVSPNFNVKRAIGNDCQGSPTGSKCYETDSVEFTWEDSGNPVTLQNSIDAVFIDKNDPSTMTVNFGGTGTFEDGTGYTNLIVTWLENPPGPSNSGNGGATSDIEFASISISESEAVPEMGTWALILSLMALFYLAYNSKSKESFKVGTA
jgi:hypothetical protein